MKCVVVIPVYRTVPKQSEAASFMQCLQVLASYDIYVLTYRELDLSRYRQMSDACGKSFYVMYFARDYFASVQSYNRLMLEKSFYQSFSSYQYMLIYQLDAWLFNDELEMWCDKGYDYIGAPIFGIAGRDCKGNILYTREMTGVGNGGFSLRRIQFCLQMLNRPGWVPLVKPVYLWKSARWKYGKSGNKVVAYLKILGEFLLKLGGYRNTLDYYVASFKLNEDMFFSLCATHIWLHPKVNIPTPNEAMLFSFEVNPSLLYSQTQRLPFGCHAFEKYEFDSFGSRYIQLH